MNLLSDYHTHTPLCRHAEGEPEAFVAQAIELGLGEYGISDHAPAIPEPFDDWRMHSTELPKYFEWIERARIAAHDKIPVRAGLECDWITGCQDWITTLRAQYNWDYFIGSVHYLPNKWDFDNPKWLGKWSKIDVEAAWKIYWKTYEEMVRSELFEICGHPDLIKKFGFYPSGDLNRFYEPVVQALAEVKGTIELNTAGWSKPCAEQYPSQTFLSLCAKAGVSLIISSDAHSPSEIGRNFSKAKHLAQSCGFSETVRFKKGTHWSIPF